MWTLFAVATLALRSSAQPLEAPGPNNAAAERAAAPTVRISSGSVVGSSNASVDSFKGIPYAQPPLGPLRLKPPQPITTSIGVINATGIPRACPQFRGPPVNTTGLGPAAAALVGGGNSTGPPPPSGEDCLTVNVQRPSNTTKGAKLPVLFWIYGGGFESGSTQSFDAQAIVTQSISSKQPVVYVSVNYRVNAFGFLAGKQLQQDGSTNLGLRDQRMGLQWVQDNIAAFGGDPDKVTIWGESAGSISVFQQTIINGGDNTYKGKALFRGAIMDSGSYLQTLNVASKLAQDVFDTVASNAGCDPKAADVLDCLRRLPYEKFADGANSVPGSTGYRGLDLSYPPRPDSHNGFYSQNPPDAVKAGQFAKVPVIIGNQKDEGTRYGLSIRNITTSDKLIDYVASYYPRATREQIANYVSSYSDDPAQGSPFDSGDANQLYPGFKKNAAVLGDMILALPRRMYLNDMIKCQPKAWSYLAEYYADIPFLGTFHASDLYAIYFNAPADVGRTIRQFYINFINNLDPNVGTKVSQWPEWTADKLDMFQFGNSSQGNSLIKDTFRQKQYEALRENYPVFLE